MERLFCGVDFHKNTSTICIVNRDGIQKGKTLTIKSSDLVTHLRNKKPMVVGIESSGGVNHVVHQLIEVGHDARIINSNMAKAIGYNGKKTDKKDALVLAKLLASNYAPQVQLRSKQARDMSLTITAREQLVRSRTSLVRHVRGLLREYGITMDVGYDNFVRLCPQALDVLKKENLLLSKILLENYQQILSLKKRELEIEGFIEEQSCQDERIQLIRQIPGVGLLGAYLMIAVIDDISRFPNSKSFASYLGLVPREYSSGDHRRLGSTTKAGNETLRRYLIHGARAFLKSSRKNDPNFIWATRLESKSGTNKATVALAHKLSRICFAMLRDGTSYQTGQLQKLAA